MYTDKQKNYFKKQLDENKCVSEKQRLKFQQILADEEQVIQVPFGAKVMVSIGTDTNEDRKEAIKMRKRDDMRLRRARAKEQARI